jgi:catechol 2,3-dioxygenase-like lactoylglutathione lyase family enzyme
MGRGSLARDNDVLAELGALGPEGGAGTRTAAAALYFASRYVTRPPAGLLAAAFARKSDTDTNACVAGALLGAFAGSDWIRPLVSELQDAPYIAGLASALAEHEPLDDGTTEWQPTLKRRLLAQLESGPTDQILELPVFGDTRIESIEVSDTRANTVTSWWLSTALGQKITTTRVTKRKEGARRAGETESAVELGRRKAGLEMAPDAAEAQLTITPAHEPAPGEGAQPKTGPRVWTAVQVRDLKRSRALYHDLLGLQIRRESPEFVFFQSNLLLEQDPSPGLDYRPLARGGSAQFKSQVLITVLLEREAFDTLHERLSRSSLPLSTILHHSEGDRFRIIDPDGQVIEVRASARG